MVPVRRFPLAADRGAWRSRCALPAIDSSGGAALVNSTAADIAKKTAFLGEAEVLRGGGSLKARPALAPAFRLKKVQTLHLSCPGFAPRRSHNLNDRLRHAEKP